MGASSSRMRNFPLEGAVFPTLQVVGWIQPFFLNY